jgi:alkylation response protein AidB-like acyl-CoA dehydrogenase
MEYRRAFDDFIRNDRERRLAETAGRLAEKFAERAAKHDEAGSFPFENFAELQQAGFMKLPVERTLGGDEISLYELVLVQERLAYGDGSTALAFGWHLGLMLHLRNARPWPEPLYRSFCREVVEHGAMINSFASEPATGSPSRGGRPETVAERTEGGWRITGRKTYSTLSPILSHFIVTAWVPEEEATAEFFVRRSKGIRIEETWNTLGMRATGSHDLILDGVFVPEEAMIRKRERDKEPNDGGGWLLHIPACYSGIAYAARDFAVKFARTYRPNSLPGPIADLPHIQHKLGLIEAELKAARTFMYETADRWDRGPERRASLRTDMGLVKYMVTNGAIRVVDLAMRIVGGASLSRTLPLERMYRDVRAGLHNPPMDDMVLSNLAKAALSETV